MSKYEHKVLLKRGGELFWKMGFAVRRRNQRVGKYSIAVVIPRPIPAGKESTIAVGRLLLADPRGEISERDLLEFMEQHLEPTFWRWLDERKLRGEKNA
jgi:hypothetical protein